MVNKPDAVQTEVRVGHIGIQRKHPDYMAVNLAIRILGGEGSNRLHNVLRTQRALTYGAQANMDALKESGDFVAQTNTRSDATAEVLRLTFDEFWRLQRDPVSERELADAKAYMTGSFPLTIETPDAIAMQVLNVVFYGLPIEDLQNFRDRVNAVTVDDIQRVARAYLRPDRLSVVLVGNVAAFGSSLKGVGFNSYETVELGSLDLTDGRFQARGRPGRRRGAAAVPSGVPAARRVPAVIGGRGADGATGRREGQGAARPGDCGKGRTGEAARDQAHHREDHDDDGRAAGAGAGRSDDLSRVPQPRPRRDQAARPAVDPGLRRGARVGARSAGSARRARAIRPRSADQPAGATRSRCCSRPRRAPSARARCRRPRTTPGPCTRRSSCRAPDLEPVVLYIDPATGLIAKQTYVAGGARQPLIEEIFSDYRVVDGVQVAYTATVRRGGQPMLERRVNVIAINPPLDPALFTRPAP